jgi:hypothetical protein
MQLTTAIAVWCAQGSLFFAKKAQNHIRQTTFFSLSVNDSFGRK